MRTRTWASMFAAGLFLLAASAVSGQQQQSEGAKLAQRGEELYGQDRLLEAETKFRAALEGVSDDDKAPCYDRLLTIYTRLERYDRAVSIGSRYEQWLATHPHEDRERLLYYELGWCYYSLGHAARAEPYLKKALAEGNLPPLPAAKQMAAVFYLAKSAERVGDAKKANGYWTSLEEKAKQGRAQPGISPQLRAEAVWHLAESYRGQKNVQLAVQRLRELLDTALEAPARRKTLELLARDYVRLEEWPAAEQALREAIQVHQTIGVTDRITFGELAAQLAHAIKKQPKNQADKREFNEWIAKASEAYQAVLNDPTLGRAYQVGSLEAFWKLQQLYQENAQLQDALTLLVKHDRWAGPTLLEPRLKAEGGQLELSLARLGNASASLRRAVQQMEGQEPLDLRELPRAYLFCGTAELMTGSTSEATRLGRKGVELYRKHQLIDDAVLVELINLVGCSARQAGDYKEAIDRFREGLAACAPGNSGAGQRCNLHLNIALLYKAQGELDKALKSCEDAETAYREMDPEPESLNSAIFKTARVSILLGLNRIEEAHKLTSPIIEICRKHGIHGGQLIATAQHAEGMWALQRGDLPAAKEAWLEVLKIQKQTSGDPLLPRTLTYLGIVADRQGDRQEAQSRFLEAREHQRDNPKAYPVTQFITLWRLAELASQAGDRQRARALLEEGLEIADRGRQQIYGEAQTRAIYFAQFTSGFDRDIEWNMLDVDPKAALAMHMRSRGRSLMEYMESAGIDPLQELKGPIGVKLKEREAELKRRLHAEMAQGWGLTPAGADEEARGNLKKTYEKTQQEYASVWSEIEASSGIYNNLTKPSLGADALAELRSRLAGGRTRLLVYHFGQDRSFAFLVGDTISVYELEAPENLVRQAAAPAPLPVTQALRGTRGLVITPAAPLPAAPEYAPPGRKVPLGYKAAGALMDNYRMLISNPGFNGTRGLVVRARDNAKPLPVQRADVLGEAILPQKLRQRIASEAPQELVVVPDGPLHRLPLEAVLLEGGPKPRYVIDVLPPIVYAPTLAVVPALLDRIQGSKPHAMSLLTVCNPAYAEEKLVLTGEGLGVLPRLPFTEDESRRVRSFFDPSRVTALEGERATAKAVAQMVRDKEIIHLAAHGITDESNNRNLFGALAFASSNDGAPGEEFLTMKDIHALPLQKCELAVLSACVTNVGPQASLEAGVTVAAGFLAAGARRVVASHWSVDDKATAQLMSVFFETVTTGENQGQPVSFAQALQQARLQVKRNPQTSAPFYWAPFVLIGPPEISGRGN